MAGNLGTRSSNIWLVVAIGFALGGLFLYAADKIVPHMHFGFNHDKEGLPTKLKTKYFTCVFSDFCITFQGRTCSRCCFGALKYVTGDLTSATLGAIGLAILVWITKFSRRSAVSIPLRQEGMSMKKLLGTIFWICWTHCRCIRCTTCFANAIYLTLMH